MKKDGVKKVITIIMVVVILITIYQYLVIAIKGGFFKKTETKVDEKIFSMVQNKEAEVTEFFTYGTSFSLSGRITNISKDNFESARLILSDGLEYEKTYKLETQIVEGNLVFDTGEINVGIGLDKLENKECYLLIRLKLNNSTEPRYYTLKNISDYKNIDYYTVTKDDQNRKINIGFLNKKSKDEAHNFLIIDVDKVEDLPEDVFDIVIDAGHGGSDTGEKFSGETEESITLEYAKLLKMELEEKGFKVKLTRDDSNTSLFTSTNVYHANGRITIACESKAKYMISFHVNNGANNLKGLEIYSPCRSNLKLAENIANKIVQNTSIQFSNNNSFKEAEGVYVRNFTKSVIKDYENTAKVKNYEPYPITLDTPYLYTIREVGGIATNAYVDGRNKEYSANKYYNSNQGAECYQIELGYIKNDLEIIKGEKEQYVKAIAEAICETVK